MARRSVPPSEIYQLKVTLRGVKPPIWRRLQVPGDIRLGRLHDVLQVAMGWDNDHMHAFTIHGVSYGRPDRELGFVSEDRVRLNELISAEKTRFRYEYDFGDSWDHELLVEIILPPEPGAAYPRCIAGKRRCPPEDCGGIWGYAEFLEAIRDPDHPEHESMREWAGDEFDPEAFDLEEINRRLPG
jgi:Plasmid pRiA4b ORF-3-like protein